MGPSDGETTPPSEPSQMERAPASDPDELMCQLHDQVIDQLSHKPWLWLRPWAWLRHTSPELRKVLESLPQALDELRRLLGPQAGPDKRTLDKATTARLTTLLSANRPELDLDEAWQLLEGVQVMYVTLGANNPTYLHSLLEVEQGLEDRRGPNWEEPWPYFGWGRVRWRQVFPTVKIDEVMAEARSSAANADCDAVDQHAALGPAAERLQRLFHARAENGRKRRTRLALRNRFFGYSLLVLAPLVVALVALTHQASEDLSWSEVVLIAVAGGVGGTVSGTLKLRGMIRITQFRLLGAGLVVQPFISAAGALFIALVLLGDLVNLVGVNQTDPSWAVLAAYGFIAGFSEPFWLGVVSKVAGTVADDTPDD